MTTNNQIAYQAAAFNAESAQEAALDATATRYFNWLQAQPATSPQLVGNAQSALLAAVTAYAKFGQVDPASVLALASRVLDNVNAHPVGNADKPAPVAAIAAPTAPSATYVQAEAQSAVNAINAIRAALTAHGITL